MIAILLVLAQAAAATPTPVPTPVTLGRPLAVGAGPRPLSEAAGSIRLNRSGAPGGGTFSAAESTVPTAAGPAAPPAPAGGPGEAAAQERMDRAVTEGTRVDVSTRRSSSRAAARAEWDAAAESCRKTPGCRPVYRDDGTGKKPLKTDDELLDELARKRGMSRDKPLSAEAPRN